MSGASCSASAFGVVADVADPLPDAVEPLPSDVVERHPSFGWAWDFGLVAEVAEAEEDVPSVGFGLVRHIAGDAFVESSDHFQ